MDTIESIAHSLELLVIAGGQHQLVQRLLAEVPDLATLWCLANEVVPEPAAMDAVCAEAVRRGGSAETALGFRAIAAHHAGDEEGARALLDNLPATSHDEVVLSAWAALGKDPIDHAERMREALRRRPDSVRLMREQYNEARNQSDRALIVSTLRWLEQHEVSERHRAWARARRHSIEGGESP